MHNNHIATNMCVCMSKVRVCTQSHTHFHAVVRSLSLNLLPSLNLRMGKKSDPTFYVRAKEICITLSLLPLNMPCQLSSFPRGSILPRRGVYVPSFIAIIIIIIVWYRIVSQWHRGDSQKYFEKWKRLLCVCMAVFACTYKLILYTFGVCKIHKVNNQTWHNI